MAYIVRRTFSDGGRLGLGLQSEELIRRIAWGNNWTTLRMCIRYAIVGPDSLANLTDTKFFIGFCSGTDQRNGYYSAYTKSAFGWQLWNNDATPDQSGPMTYTANAGFPYYNRNYSSGFVQWHYNGSAFSNLAASNGGAPGVPTVYGCAVQRCVFMMIEIKKPGAPYGNATQYSMRRLSSQGVSTNHTNDHFLQNCLKGANFVGDQSLTMSSEQLMAAPVPETEAPLDCITITWQGPCPLEFYDIVLFDRYGPFL